jgi:hypothetical protein
MWARWTVVWGLLAGSFLAGACGADDGDVVGAGAAQAAGGRAGAPAGGAAGSGRAGAGQHAGSGAGELGSGGTAGEAGSGGAGEAGAAPLPPELSFARVQAPASSAIRALWGSGADDVFAVGDEGQLFHFFERTWRLENTATDSALTGIWASGPGDIYVSVDDNFVLHSPGSGVWTPEPLPAGYKLTDIWGSGAGDIYALTGDGVFRGDGSGVWEFEAIEPASAPLTAVWGSSASDVFAVAAFAETPTVFHSDGAGEWEEQAGPPATLSDVAGSAPDHVFAAGGNTVYASRGDGTWTAELVLENDVVGAVFALSRSAVYACSENGLLFRSNGAGEWSEGQPVNPNGISPPCQALWASGPFDVYAGTTRGLFRGAE